MKKLNNKELAFVEQYLITLSPYDAAKAAKYSESMSKSKAFCWVSESKCPSHKRHVFDEIQKRVKKRAKKAEIDAEWLLRRLGDEANADLSDLIDESDQLKPIKQWPLIWRQGLIAGIDVQATIGDDGPAKLTKIKLSDRVKRLELIGRHVDVQAFKDKVEVDPSKNLMDFFDQLKSTKGPPSDR